jgi:hypothetical protein
MVKTTDTTTDMVTNTPRLKTAIAVLSLALLFAITSSAYAAKKKTGTQLAKTVVDRWLVLLDTGAGEKAYEQSDTLFKNKTTEAQWKNSLKDRVAFGKFIDRRLRMKQTDSDNLLIFQYTTNFENKKSVTETVVPHLDKDGQWRVSDYTIEQ